MEIQCRLTPRKSQLSFAVITSTIGRDELEQAILSVQNQSYPAQHYVFVDGQGFWRSAEKILSKFPNVTPIYLPMNTGKNGWFNSRINAIAPFLVEEDIICFLDDDNLYHPTHIEKFANIFQATDINWAYSLRNFIDMDNKFICHDITESIGFHYYEKPKCLEFDFKNVRLNIGFPEPMIDVNTYAFHKNLAQELATTWNMLGFGNDKMIFKTLKDSPHLKCACTDSFTVDYRINPKTFGQGVLWQNLSQIFSNPTDIENAIYKIFATLNKP